MTSYIMAGTRQSHMPRKRSPEVKEAKRLEYAQKFAEDQEALLSPEAKKAAGDHVKEMIVKKEPGKPTKL
jgi:hypothetical protein